MRGGGKGRQAGRKGTKERKKKKEEKVKSLPCRNLIFLLSLSPPLSPLTICHSPEEEKYRDGKLAASAKEWKTHLEGD